MKIKFLKPFRLYNPIGDDFMMAEGTIENMEKEDYAQWLIDNGFAEEVKEGVKESGWWKPRLRERYYYFGSNGEVYSNQWENDSLDNGRLKLGSVFKTEEAAIRCRDYWEAIATVRQDEGVLTTEEARKQVANGNRVYCLMPPGTVRNSISVVAPGGIYFKDTESAGASWDAHRKEWQTIMNYDWSRE